MGNLRTTHCSSVKLILINGVLTTIKKVLNIEEAARPAGPRDILLAGKNARAGEYARHH